ncbi:histidine kinase [Pontibacter sp. 172403-2]|uniref:sensor histidine kinase n=1 Tax=Pontibacter rufus TaxID=2791028 RepID=UPI0018AF94D9|nr:histidine kinase [Pontibacter sp. 172403-2]MBF9252301.1 histidine kinase [Pontibacter sp. 172403-2]
MANTFINRHGYILIQLLVLLGLLLLLCQPLGWDIKLPAQFWVKQAIVFFLWVGLFYLNMQVLVPQFLFQNRVGLFAAAMLVAVAVVLLISQAADSWLNLPELMNQAFNPGGNDKPVKAGLHINPVMLLATMLVLGISTSIKTVQKWQKDAEIRQSLEKQRISTELSFLKAQINPHFFFNTLHSIYALTMINIETSREALHTLSRMMRYVLYETQAGTTLLSKEIEFLQDYVNLMQLRLTDKVTITFDKPTPLHDVPVAPMLFLPFVENAFKHGVSALLPSSIRITICQQGQVVELDVRNTILPEKRVVLEESSGIGLANTSRRLDLLYPGHYTLTVTEKTPENEYRAHLTLDLS